MILVSVTDAAYFTHIPASTIRRWVSEGRLDRHGGKIDMLAVEKVANQIGPGRNRATHRKACA